MSLEISNVLSGSLSESLSSFSDADTDSDTADKDISLNLDYNLGRYTLSSITACQKEERKNKQDLFNVAVYFWQIVAPPAPDFFNYQLSEIETSLFTQEFKIASPADDPINFVAGLFYSDQDTHQYYLREFIGNTFDRDQWMTSKSFAAYGRVGWKLGESLNILTGLRFNRDELDYRTDQRTAQAPNVGVHVVQSKDSSSMALVGDVTLQKIVNPYSMLYGTYARGYKPEIYSTNGNLAPGQEVEGPVDQEHINHFELGGKFTWMNGRLITNLAAFDTIYKGYQVQITDTNVLAGMPEVKAAGEAETKGLELDVTALPTQDLKLTFSAAYIDAQFNDFPNANAFGGQTDEEGAFTVEGGTTRLQDLSGKPMPNSPKFKGVLSVEQRIPQTALPFDVILGGRYSYQTKAILLPDQNPHAVQPAFGILNLNVKAVSLSEKYSLTLFVNNVFDKYYNVNLEDYWSPLWASNAVVGTPARDARRYAGLRFDVKF